MKYLELSGCMYPLNEDVIFVKRVNAVGVLELKLHYVNGTGNGVLIGDISNVKHLPMEQQIELSLKGRIKVLNF